MLISPDLLRSTRAKTRLTAAESAAVVSVPVQTWRGWEYGKAYIPGAVFELFLIKAGLLQVNRLKHLGKLDLSELSPTVENIKAYRVQAGLTQLEAAELVHVSRSTWIHYEQDKTIMRLPVFELFLRKAGWIITANPAPKKDLPIVSAHIYAKRRQAGLTQDEAAELVYVPAKTWRNWEQGKTTMPRVVFELFILKCGWQLTETEPQVSKQRIAADVEAWLNE